MPDQDRIIVTNNTPLLALSAATGDLDVLRALYTRVVVPYEVAEEIRSGGKAAFGLDVFDQACSRNDFSGKISVTTKIA